MTKALFLQQNLKDGEHYAGIVLGKDGEQDYHLIMLPGDADQAAWNEQVKWAKSIGGTLPTRREQRVAFANCKELFKPEAYWSGEQHAIISGYAWCQGFYDGGQYYGSKSSQLRARAVRRLIIL